MVAKQRGTKQNSELFSDSLDIYDYEIQVSENALSVLERSEQISNWDKERILALADLQNVQRCGSCESRKVTPKTLARVKDFKILEFRFPDENGFYGS